MNNLERSVFVEDELESYPLWGFSDGGDKIVVTRGRTSEEAWTHAAKSFRRGVGVIHCDSLPIDAGKRYSVSHPFNWYTQKPEYLKTK